MAKRTHPEESGVNESTPKRARLINGSDHPDSPSETPSRPRSILKTTETNGDLTPKSVRKVLFTPSAPTNGHNGDSALLETPISKAKRLDSSARKKSNKRVLASVDENDEDDAADNGDDELADCILNDEDGPGQSGLAEQEDNIEPDTPSKKKPPGRPRGKRKEKSPTPPGDLLPHDLFFFHNRTGGNKTSTNTFPAGALLNHEDYFTHIHAYADPHADDLEHLSDLHRFSFDQWSFELDCAFSICLYGYGSKTRLITDFAAHLHDTLPEVPVVVIVNGYNPSLTPKDILTTLSSALLPSSVKLPAQPLALLDALLAHLTSHPPRHPAYLLIHSIDARPLRKHQQIIARLASHPSICLLATADLPTFPLLWPLPLLTQLRFIYHDTTTFLPYDAEIDTVDEVNTLLGRSGRRVGGKDGVTFVLRSLPENARSLFRILVAEQLALMDAGVMSEEAIIHGGQDEDEDERLGFEEMDVDDDPETPSKRGRKKKAKPAEPKRRKEAPVEGVEWRMLYHKAVEEFVCSSEHGFRNLLKEFYDHQIVESRKDGMGGERLVVPFGRGELEALLEELI